MFARGNNPPKPLRRTPGGRSGEGLKISRSRRNTAWTGIGALVVVVIFAILPYEVYAGTTAILVQGFIILTLASMWNLLAGYAGLVSVGQQAFLGLGAYFVLIPAMHGVSPFAGIAIAAVGAGVCAIPLWWLVSRLRTGYFAIATWVLASAIMLFIERFPSIGGGTGMPLPGFTGMDPTLLSAYTYWAGLAVVVLAIAAVYFLLRSRVGLVLTAIRDDETAARSSGVRVGFARALVFVVAAVGCGAAGGVLAIEQLGVQPGTSGGVFSVTWTAIMAFAVIIGGIGTIEGPIIGTIVYMVLQQGLQRYNAWYLIILGLVAIVVTLFARRGLWGTLDEKFSIRLLPTGYYVRLPGEQRGRRRGRSSLTPTVDGEPARSAENAVTAEAPEAPEAPAAEPARGTVKKE
jgi:branched-chain amino acid transport system permease protein